MNDARRSITDTINMAIQNEATEKVKQTAVSAALTGTNFSLLQAQPRPPS